jgi:hypothetical protein
MIAKLVYFHFSFGFEYLSPTVVKYEKDHGM